MNEFQLTRGLAGFSLGLGLAELVAPRQVARWIGIDEEKNAPLLRLCGLREIGSGIGLMQGRPAHFLWSRVAGDAIDLALLGAALRANDADRRRVGRAIAAVAAVTMLDVVAAFLRSRNYGEAGWRDPRPMEERSGIARGATPASATPVRSVWDETVFEMRDTRDARAARESVSISQPMPEPGSAASAPASMPDQGAMIH